MKKAFFYGDSNTFGYDPADYLTGRYPWQHRWTGILKDRFTGEWEIKVDGMPGRVIPKPGRAVRFLADRVRAEMPLDLFAVMLGTNDILGTLHPDAERSAREMEVLLDAVQELGIPRILLIAPPGIELTDLSFDASYVSGDRSYAERYRSQGKKLTRLYRELAARKGYLFADASSWDLDFAFDAVHLSEKGHETFAEEMTEIMREIT